MKPRIYLIPLLLAGSLLSSGPLAAQENAPLVGRLSIQWGDPHPELGMDPVKRVFLADDRGVTTELTMSEEMLRGGVSHWHGKRVKVFPRGKVTRGGTVGGAVGAPPVAVAAVRLLAEPEARATVSGSQPWVSVLCKFADIAEEPRDLAFFQNMYANTPGGLDHYWREVSYDKINIVGSVAIDWVTLPQTQSTYIPNPGENADADLNRLFNDCTAAVDPFVDFSNGGTPFAGINLMFNEVLDCCAWGGGRFATLDGVTKVWRVTWEPPWAFRNAGVIAHEMGHGFGLPHANNWDNDGNPYDSPWDVMSSATGYGVSHATYGVLGKHVNAYHKDTLGWFDQARRFEATTGSSTTISLDHTALSGSTNYQVAIIPIGDGSSWYTVEARLRSGDYEASLPGDAVIIHEVANRAEPSWAVDGDTPPANYGDNEGTMWKVGETFIDAVNGILIQVDAATATGFVVTILSLELDLFSDGFESGDVLLWSSSVGS